MAFDAELRERLHDVAVRVPVDEPSIDRLVRRGRTRSRLRTVSVTLLISFAVTAGVLSTVPAARNAVATAVRELASLLVPPSEELRREGLGEVDPSSVEVLAKTRSGGSTYVLYWFETTVATCVEVAKSERTGEEALAAAALRSEGGGCGPPPRPTEEMPIQLSVGIDYAEVVSIPGFTVSEIRAVRVTFRDGTSVEQPTVRVADAGMNAFIVAERRPYDPDAFCVTRIEGLDRDGRRLATIHVPRSPAGSCA